MTNIEICQAIVAEKQYREVDGVLIDLFSASAVVRVHDALNEANQAKFAGMATIPAMVHLAFELIS